MHPLVLSIDYEITHQYGSLVMTALPSVITFQNTEGTLLICRLGFLAK